MNMTHVKQTYEVFSNSMFNSHVLFCLSGLYLYLHSLENKSKKILTVRSLGPFLTFVHLLYRFYLVFRWCWSNTSQSDW